MKSRRVVGLIRHNDADLYRLRIAGTAMTATGNRPFWVVGRRWVDVEDLHQGMKVRRSNGSTATIRKVLRLDLPAEKVYESPWRRVGA